MKQLANLLICLHGYIIANFVGFGIDICVFGFDDDA